MVTIPFQIILPLGLGLQGYQEDFRLQKEELLILDWGKMSRKIVCKILLCILFRGDGLGYYLA